MPTEELRRDKEVEAWSEDVKIFDCWFDADAWSSGLWAS